MFGHRELVALETWMDVTYQKRQGELAVNVPKDMYTVGRKQGYLDAIREIGMKIKELSENQELPEQPKVTTNEQKS